MASSTSTDGRGLSIASARPSRLAPQSYLERVIPILVFVISLLYLCLFLRYSAMDPDEGIVIQGAERILRGEVPYRDFFSFYTPGSYYLLAYIFRAFGDSFVVARTSIAIIGAGSTLVTYLLARRVCTWRMALLAAGLSATTGVAYRFIVLHNWYATFFTCLTVYAAVRVLESKKTLWAFAAGSFAAFAVLIEQSKGSGLCAGLVVGYCVLRCFGRVEAHRTGTAMLGFIWPWLILILYFGARGAVGMMWHDWLWPLRHYTNVNHVFYGYQSWPMQASDIILHTGPWWIRPWKYLAITPGFVVPVLPLIAIAWLAYSTLKLRNGDDSRSCQYYVLLSATLSGLLLAVVFVRPDINHFMYLAPLWYVVLAWILGSSAVRPPILQILRPYLIVYVCVAFGLMGFALLLRVNTAQNQIWTRRGRVTTPANDTVIGYVQAHTKSEDDLLVYPYLPLYNYLTATRSPTRLDFFQSGMNTAEQAHQIVASLESQRNRAVLFEPEFAEKFATSWPQTPLRDIANDPVADYIIRNYHMCAALTASPGWRLQFLVRKGENCTS